jgi:hypothetical protein
MAEWLKASDCKSDDLFYVGSNPASPKPLNDRLFGYSL